MCGIAGIWNFDGKPVRQESISRFTNSLVHRGPDGGGTWRGDEVGIALGHRRLAILDTSRDGEQPMSYDNGRYWIIHNGEIYNFLELREELEDKGHRFFSQTDTEVILAAYMVWGPEMLTKFNGMWAFAIFDRQEKTLFIARDRFGIKPFLYRKTEYQFACASELKSFKFLDGFTPTIDRESASVFLRNGFGIEGTRRTMLEEVQRLQGGHYGIVKSGELSIYRWWNTLDHLIKPHSGLREQAEEFREIFYDSVKLRMRSDVPIGSCLSGGFDSSSVVCAIAEIGRKHSEARLSSDWQQTFVATFPGFFNDESEEAREIIDFAGVKGNFFPIGDDECLKQIDKILYDFDDVYIGLPTPAWLIYRELRRAKVVVSLDGHGADELMGGYVQGDYILFHDAPSLIFSPLQNKKRVDRYRKILKRYQRNNPSTIPVKSLPHAIFEYHPSLSLARHFRSAYFKLLHKRKPNLPSVVNSGLNFLRSQPQVESDEFATVGGTDTTPDHWGDFNISLYRMFHSTVLPSILRNFERLSMAHGVEVRMPYMDWRLVRFVFSLADSCKISEGMNKRVAREAMKGKIPEAIRVAGHKIGFNSPMPEWFSGPLIPWIQSITDARKLKDHDLIDMPALRNFAHENTESKSWTWLNCGTVWPYMHYLWFEQEFLKK